MPRAPERPTPPQAPVADLAEWLDACLAPRLREAVSLAYRLADPSPDPRRHRASLRDVAKPFGVSRERARQLLERALAWLRAPDARAAAAPLYAAAAAILRRAGGNLDPRDLAALPPDPAWHGLSPVGAFRLLGDVSPAAPPQLFRDFFTLHPAAVLREAADALETFLADPSSPPLLPLADLVARLPDSLPVAAADRPPLVRALALHTPAGVMTRDGLCGLAPAAVPALLRQILRKRGESSVAAIARAYNALVVPGNALGEGALRRRLAADPGILRTRINHYAPAP